ncbi:MAG: hypothetical protein CM15mP74_11100 [Halieaceae bacterium]|nr:MAG: hypothetical protein CM15mP74_11100 [Halieaceae bacterium]
MEPLLGAQASNGQVAFTRRGDLLVDQSGLLETANGHIVLGEGGGPITVPVGVDLAITNDGTVTATDPVQPDAPPTYCRKPFYCDATGNPHGASNGRVLYEPIAARR